MNDSEQMTVTRVQDGDGSHIEPPLDAMWDGHTKLRWFAAVIACDVGIPVTVQPGGSADTYRVTVAGSCYSPFEDFRATWTFMTGVIAGAKARASA